MSTRPKSTRPAARSKVARAPWQPPAFAVEPWYNDATDLRCLRDAKPERVDDDAAGGRLVLTLTTPAGATVTLRYVGVHRHNVPCYACDQGVGEWRRDEFERATGGRTLHRITWRSEAAGSTTQWRIEADAVALQVEPVRRRRGRGRGRR